MKFSNFECNEIINYAENSILQQWERIELKNSKYFLKF